MLFIFKNKNNLFFNTFEKNKVNRESVYLTIIVFQYKKL